MRGIVGLLVTLLVFCTCAAGAEEITPLTQAHRDALQRIRIDPKPKELNQNSHFWVSDEKTHYLWKESVTDLGGIMVGVGTDQMYTMAAWAKPSVLILMDFDQAIVDLHHAYEVFFKSAKTIQELTALFQPKSERSTIKLLETELKDPEQRKRSVRAYKLSRQLLWARFRNSRTRYTRWKVASIFTDDAQYQWVRQMWATGRVYSVRGDLTAKQTLNDISAFAKSYGEPIRVLYVSNAEQYFPLRSGYQQNIEGLHIDDSSLILRTARFGPKKAADGAYHYLTQTIADFRRWYVFPDLTKPKMFIYRKPVMGKKGYSTLGGPEPRQERLQRRLRK
jgi:hypothetical protein